VSTARAGRALLTATAAAAAVWSGVALAQSEDLLECTSQAMTPAFRDKLADAMLADEHEGEALFEQLGTVSDDCARQYGLAEDKGGAYFTYSLARLPRDAFIVRLGAQGISAQVVDQALDFGEGRRNPTITGRLSKPQVDKLVAALSAAGVDIEAVAESSWKMIGAYAAASSLMWENRGKLR
jgi:hypothetical protein